MHPPQPPPLVVPTVPGYVGHVLALVVLLGVTGFTARKLFTMAELRGTIRGAPERSLVIASRDRRLTEDVAVYRLQAPDAATPGRWKIQLTRDQAARHAVGERVVVRCDDAECYLPDSTYISDGNLIFDLILLVIEIGAVIGAVVLLRGRLALRATLRGDHLPAVRVRRR